MTAEREIDFVEGDRAIRIWQKGIPAVIKGEEVLVDVLFNFTEEGLIIDVMLDGEAIETSSETYTELVEAMCDD